MIEFLIDIRQNIYVIILVSVWSKVTQYRKVWFGHHITCTRSPLLSPSYLAYSLVS